MAGGVAVDQQGARSGSGDTLFVSDPTAEAEHVARALRSSGYTVVDVPLSMLVARVAVQRPRIVLVDADSQGALETVARVRELPHGDDIHVLFIAAPGGVIATREEALAHEGSGLFLRPIDLQALVREVDSLTMGVGQRGGDPAGSGTPRPSIATSSQSATGASASVPPASVRAAQSSKTRDSTRPPSEPPPTSVAWAAAPRAIGLGPPVSAGLQRLLVEAEQRAHLAASESAPPSPEQEVDSVLPAELLAALDEPLDDDDRDADVMVPTRPPTIARERTNDGGVPRTTGASSTSGGATPHSSITTGAGAGTGEHPLTPLPAAADERPSAVPSTSASDAGATRALGPWEAMRVVANAISSRATGSLCLSFAETERRVLLREGDVVTCASTSEEESLIAFLGVRGDLPRETVRRLGPRFPAYGRHAGAALVARGYLRQDQMWTTLRAHAEWVLGRVLQVAESRVAMEAQAPGRLANEPSVFGGASGAEVFVEVVRRIVTPGDAIERLGGVQSHLGQGEMAHLLGESALATAEMELVRGAPGRTVQDVLEGAPDGDFASAIFALTELRVVEVLPRVGAMEADADSNAAEVAALDSEAIRESVRARLQLVEDGDYFAVLGVRRDATGYEVRRAFLELRRNFDVSRLLSPEVADLAHDVRTIATVLEEAYEILKDPARRERYRRAIEAVS
ncbi:MAG TPA: hypothetical protein VGY54_15660 [Polyangiaceae bacterium]|nr:hypothetical protein [Polyangiaceae bacterium]